MKLCILLGYKFLIKNFNFGVNRCISGRDIRKHEIYKIGHISAIMRRTLHYSWGHQVHFWSRDCALKFFL